MRNPNSEPAIQIGCIDGSVITVTRSGSEIRLRVGEEVVSLSRDAGIRLAGALRIGNQPQTSTPGTKPRTRLPRLGSVANPTIADLVKAGFLSAGTALTFKRHDEQHIATLTENGEIVLNGSNYPTPSAAAKAASGGKSLNGWDVWKVHGSPISEARWLYRAANFPGEGHAFADRTADGMRRVVQKWVFYAIERRLDPGAPQDNLDAFLSGNGYSDKTLEMYRRYLRNWQDHYSQNFVDDQSSSGNDVADARSPWL